MRMIDMIMNEINLIKVIYNSVFDRILGYNASMTFVFDAEIAGIIPKKVGINITTKIAKIMDKWETKNMISNSV